MDEWKHLFLTGEFPARDYLLSGLTLEQVTLRPDGSSHSIYEELWHAAGYQRSIVERDQAAADGDHYPSAAPEHEQQWHDLVQQFLELVGQVRLLVLRGRLGARGDTLELLHRLVERLDTVVGGLEGRDRLIDTVLAIVQIGGPVRQRLGLEEGHRVVERARDLEAGRQAILRPVDEIRRALQGQQIVAHRGAQPEVSHDPPFWSLLDSRRCSRPCCCSATAVPTGQKR